MNIMHMAEAMYKTVVSPNLLRLYTRRSFLLDACAVLPFIKRPSCRLITSGCIHDGRRMRSTVYTTVVFMCSATMLNDRRVLNELNLQAERKVNG